MAVIQKTLFAENLDRYQTFVTDTNPSSEYFKITELSDTLTGGKNAFLIQGSEYLVSDTLIKIEIKDANGDIIYHEPGEGIVSSSVGGTEIVTEYYEGVSKVVAVHIYPDTAYGPATITILGELSSYNNNGLNTPIPVEWEGQYNVKWQKQINVNPSLANTTKIRFYRRPSATISETLSPIYTIVDGLKVQSNVVSSFANIKISQMETFAGDVKRIKVFRTSLGDISDSDLIQDILVESKELLTTYQLSGSVVGNGGLFTSETLEKLWIANGVTTQLTSSRIDNGVKLSGAGNFRYSASLNLSDISVYELGVDAFYSASTASNLGIYISGSNNGEYLIGTLNGITPTKNLKDQIIQFSLPLAEPTASLYFSQSQSEWHLGNVSLKLTQDTAFSPSEIEFVTSMPTVIGNETYEFNFEFYDVNNNYVPVAVTQSALFTGGNNNLGGTITLISSSQSSSLSQLYAVSSSISGTAALYLTSSVATSSLYLTASLSTSSLYLSASIATASYSASVVSASVYTLSGSVSSSISVVSSSIGLVSSSISQSVYQGLLPAFTKVQNLADGNYSGSFISGNIIYAPVIGGQLGYFSTLFKVGATSPIYLDARQSPRKIFIGGAIPSGDTEYSGAFNNSNTSVYLDSNGYFSLKDKLTWNGSTLSINGNLAVGTTLAGSSFGTLATKSSVSATTDVTGLGVLGTRDTVAATHIDAGAVTETKIGTGAVSNTKIAADAVTEAKIATNAITEGKISANAVVADKIAANAIVADKIAADAVTAGKIIAGAISADKIAANAVTADKISANAVTADKIIANAITADKVTANTLNASHISALDFTGKNAVFTTGQIGGWNISADRLSSPADASGYSRLTLNPSPLIAVNNTSGVPKCTIRAGDLSDLTAGSNVTMTFAAISSPSNAVSNVNDYTYGTGTSFSVSSQGTYSGTLSFTNGNASLLTTPSPWSGYAYIALYYQIASDSGFSTVIANGYVSGAGTGAQGSTATIQNSTVGIQVSFPSAGTYYSRFYWQRQVYSNTTATTTCYAVSSGTKTSAVAQTADATELTDKGFQVVNSSLFYFRIKRDSGYYDTATPYVQVGGKISATDNIIAYYSDGRLKDVEGKIENPLDKIDKLNGVYYKQNKLAEGFGFTNERRQVGLIAQEVNEVLPEVIDLAPFDMDVDNGTSKSGENYMTLNYDRVVPLLVECIKELKKEIQELKNK